METRRGKFFVFQILSELSNPDCTNGYTYSVALVEKRDWKDIEEVKE